MRRNIITISVVVGVFALAPTAAFAESSSSSSSDDISSTDDSSTDAESSGAEAEQEVGATVAPSRIDTGAGGTANPALPAWALALGAVSLFGFAAAPTIARGRS